MYLPAVETPGVYARCICRTLTGGALQALTVEECLEFYFR